MDFERKTTVWVGVEDAFDFFADPANMPLYVPTVTLEEAIAVDGDPESEPDAEAGAVGPQATFVPDRNEHRVQPGACPVSSTTARSRSSPGRRAAPTS